MTIRNDLDNGVSENVYVTPKEMERALNRMEDQVEKGPMQVLTFSQDLLTYTSAIVKQPENVQMKMLSLLTNGFSKMVQITEACLKSGDLSEQVDMKASLELFGYLMYGNALLLDGSTSDSDQSSSSSKNKKKRTGLEWNHLKIKMAEACGKLLSFPVVRLFESRVDCESLISCIVKLLHHFAEHPENMKISVLRQLVLDGLVHAVVDQAYLTGTI